LLALSLFLYLLGAFYTILFTSGSSLIKMENITKIKIQKKLSKYAVVIVHRESGRLKERTLVLEENQIEVMKDSLLLEKLIEEKNINLKVNKLGIHTFITALIIMVGFYTLVFKEANKNIGYCYGIIVLFGCLALLLKMILRSKNLRYNKTTS
jgi:multisubunit Na+/H+ antiporter MnhC subunit